MHTWQRAMIFLATHPGITDFMHRHLNRSALARQFCGGQSGTTAVEKALELKAGNRTVSFFFLGEYVTDPAEIRATVRSLAATAGSVRAAGTCS